MRTWGVLVLILGAGASAALAQKDYESFARRSQERQEQYRKKQASIYADVHREWAEGKYGRNVDSANQEIERRVRELKSWNAGQKRQFREDAEAQGIRLVEPPGEGAFKWNEIVDYRVATRGARRDRYPDLAEADAATLGDELRAREPARVRAALGAARARGVKLPPDDLALLLMRSREADQVAEVARQLLSSDPQGGPAVLARHVMQGRPAAEQVRALLGTDAERRIARARQIEPRRAELIRLAQAVHATDEPGLQAIDRLARVPGGDVGALLTRLAGDKSSVVAARARAALSLRGGR